MTSSTVLRVKRRLEENPQDALVLLCKRKKTDDEVSPSLFVFRGSVDSQETTPAKTIAPKITTKLNSVANVDDIIKKIRQEKKETVTNNRYKIVNCSRGIMENKSADDEGLFDMVDLQKNYDESEDIEYIYDLYTSVKDDFDISLLDNLVSIENYETELIFANYRGPQDAGSDEEEEEDDDSNDENNWRNEYPDSDPSSIDEEDMVKALQNCNIEDDLSSDTGEDKIYDEPPDLFNEDVKRYGFAYAKYKAKVQNEDSTITNSSYVHCSKFKDMDEETIEGYKDDSDDGFYYGQEEDSEQYRQQYEQHDSSDEYSPD